MQVATAVAGEGADDEAIAKLQKQMERFTTFEDFAKNRFDLQKKISEGLTKTGLPDDPSDEQLAEYRQANGIPETHEGYEFDFGEGVVLGGEDKAVLDAMLPKMHASNIPNDVANGLAKDFFEARAAEVQKRKDQDGLDSQRAQSILRESWQGDFQANVNIFKSVIGQMPEGLREGIINARLPDGTGLMNDPNFVQFMVQRERQANPTVTVVPSSDGNPVQTINDEIKSLEDRMDTDEWFKDDAAQKRYRELVTARDKLNKN